MAKKNGYTYSTINGQRFRSTTNVLGVSQVEGLEELIRDLADFGDNAMPELYSAADRAAQVVLKRAQDKISVETGVAKKSLKIAKPKTKKGVYIAVSRVTFGKEAAYIVPLELGHDTHSTYVQPRPFMRPAADESKSDVVDIMIKSMNEILDDLLKG